MENLFKAYLLIGLYTFLYVQCVWSAAQTPPKPPITSVNCTTEENCTAVDKNAVCGYTSSAINCSCKSDYKSDGNVCVKKVLNDSCGKIEDCVHVGNATCDTNKCQCSGSFKVNGAACAKIVVGDTCKVSADCPSNADCNTEKTCACNSGYTAENGLCLFGVGASCLKKVECVSNADCDVATKKCTCSTGFSASNVLCAKQSSADSLKKTINAIVVSFLCAALLTIV